jgi:hypothetical protein
MIANQNSHSPERFGMSVNAAAGLGERRRLTVDLGSAEVDRYGNNETSGNPHTSIDVRPVANQDGSGVELGGEHNSPIVPGGKREERGKPAGERESTLSASGTHNPLCSK